MMKTDTSLKSLKYISLSFSILLLMLLTQNLYADEGPTLPKGLGGASEKSDDTGPPGLPSGLGSKSKAAKIYSEEKSL